MRFLVAVLMKRVLPTQRGDFSNSFRCVYGGRNDYPLCEMLEKYVDTVRSLALPMLAGEALEEMAQQQFDVLVSDIGMPEMDGYALISKVRQLPVERGGRIPAAALTAYAGIEDRRRALSAGYQMHVPKPVEPAELTSVVAGLAERYLATASDQ